jgi:hypothetical protein
MAAGDQVVIKDEQHRALGEYLRRYGGGDDLVLTQQGDGSIIIGGGLADSWEITSVGTVIPDSGETVEL